MKLVRRLILLIVIAALAYPAWLGFLIWQQSHRDELHSADAIVVLGAAQYDGKPSPVFRARLDHAAYLYREGFSDVVIVTGGKRAGDRFTEAEAGKDYLVDKELPESAIVGESHGATTLASLREVKEIAEERKFDSVLLVSDPLHSERVKRIAVDLGFEENYASPASYVELNRSRETKAKELLREIVSLIAYEILNR